MTPKIFFVCFLFAACTNEGVGTDAAAVDACTDGTPRTDGAYLARLDSVEYWMRYFQDGHVVLLAGREGPGLHLPDLLVRSAVSNPSIGLHNLPVQRRGMELQFAAQVENGEIRYRGTEIACDTLHFLKESGITGKRATLRYAFVPQAKL
jgi:hypothetical protein